MHIKLLIISLFALMISSQLLLSQPVAPMLVRQLDYLEPYNQAPASTCALMMRISPNNTVFPLNVFLKLPSSPNYFWIIKNDIIPPFPEEQIITYWFDLGQFGVPAGTRINLMDIYFTWQEYFPAFPNQFPPTIFLPIEVIPSDATIGSLGLERMSTLSYGIITPYTYTFPTINLTNILDSLSKYIVYRGCQVPNIDLDSATNFPGSTAGYAGDKNACGPAGAANSLQWLELQHSELNSGTTHRQKLIELSGMMNRGNNRGVTTENFIKGKLAFIDKYKLPIKVKFQSSYAHRTNDIASPDTTYGHKARNDNANKTNPEKSVITWDWLYKEMNHGEDVELGMDFYEWDGTQWVYKGGHIATVTGVAQVAGAKKVWLKDDSRQNAEGGTEQNKLTWRTLGTSELPILDEWSQGNKACVITDVVSESYDPNVQYQLKSNTIKFGKIKYKSPLNLTYTSAGNFSAVVLPHTDTKWVNVVARIPGSDSVARIVDNMKLYPFGIPVFRSYEYDMDWLGVTNPWNFDSLEIQITITNNLLKTPIINPDSWELVPLEYDEYSVGNVTSSTLTNASGTITTTKKIKDLWKDISEPVFDSTKAATVEVNHGCTFTNIDLDNVSNPSSTATGYSGDFNSCAPAAAANSMQWLQDTHPEIKPAAADARSKLAEFNKLMKTTSADGTKPVEFIEGKLAFIEKYKLPIKVKFQGIFYKKGTEITAPSSTYNQKAECQNASDGAYPTSEWLTSEIKHGEDVEMQFGYYKVFLPTADGMDKDKLILERNGGHKVAVTGVNDNGGVIKISFKHDKYQDSANKPGRIGTVEDEMPWTVVECDKGKMVVLGNPWRGSDGNIYIRVVEDLVSESYDENVQFSMNESSVELNRVNFLAPYEQDVSTSCYFMADFFSNTSVSYLNLSINNIETGKPVWIAKNIPILPFERTRTVSYGFNLSEVGIKTRQLADSLTIQYFISNEMWDQYKDKGIVKTINMDLVDYYVNEGIESSENLPDLEQDTSGLVFDITSTISDTVYRGCNVPNIDLDNRGHGPNSVPGYAGDANACAPASAANSLEWLEKTSDQIDSTGTLRDKLHELSAMMKRQRGKGVINAKDFIEGKLAFIDKHKLPIKVKFQSFDLPPDSVVRSPDTTNGRGYGHTADNRRTKESAFPTWEWLLSEMQHGEDVEMLFVWRDGNGDLNGHAVTVTGVAKQGRVKRLWIKDDTQQDRPGLGRTSKNKRDSSGEEVLEWKTDRQGKPYVTRLGGEGRFIHSIISESYDPSVRFSSDRSSARFQQYHYVTPNGISHTGMGNFSIAFQPDSLVHYINVFARIDSLRNPQWIVQNLPNMPFDKARRVSSGFNISSFGIPEGDRIADLEYAIFESDTFMTSMPVINEWYYSPVQSIKFSIGDNGTLEDATRPAFSTIAADIPAFIPPLGITDTTYRGCNVPNIDLDSSAHNPGNTPGYAGDYNACGPAAAANSIQWLESIDKTIDSKIDLREKLKELSKMMKREDNEGVTTENFIKGKLEFIQKYKLPIEVKFQSFRFSKDSVLKTTDNDGNELKAQNKNTKDNGYPTWEFLVKEMKDNEDVEIEYGKYDADGNRIGGHMVTATGTISIGGKRYVFIKDDTRQDSSGLGKADDRDEKGEEIIPWDSTTTGIPLLKRWGSSNRRVESIISESPKIEPAKAIKVLKIGKVNFIKPGVSKSRKGILLYQPKGNSAENPLYGNIIARKPGSDKTYWLAKNLVIDPGTTLDTLKYWFDFDMMEKIVDQVLDLPEIELGITADESPWTKMNSSEAWETFTINDFDYDVTGGSKDIPPVIQTEEPEEPQFSVPQDYSYNHRSPEDIFNLDLYSGRSKIYPGYPSDPGGGGPASAANSLLWMDKSNNNLSLGLGQYQLMELISNLSSREFNSGIRTEELALGMLQFIDSVKVPLSIYYISTDIKSSVLVSPDKRYGHFANQLPGTSDGFPFWQTFVNEIKASRGVQLVLQWIAPDGSRIHSQLVSAAGFSNSAGVNNIWVIDDCDQTKIGGKSATQLTWMQTAKNVPFLYEWSFSDTLCVVSGLISETYDKDIKFIDVSVPEINSGDAGLTISANPSADGESIRISFNLEEQSSFGLELYDLRGSRIAGIASGNGASGYQSINWDCKLPDGSVIAGGIYLLVLKTAGGAYCTKLIRL